MRRVWWSETSACGVFEALQGGGGTGCTCAEPQPPSPSSQPRQRPGETALWGTGVRCRGKQAALGPSTPVGGSSSHGVPMARGDPEREGESGDAVSSGATACMHQSWALPLAPVRR